VPSGADLPPAGILSREPAAVPQPQRLRGEEEMGSIRGSALFFCPIFFDLFPRARAGGMGMVYNVHVTG